MSQFARPLTSLLLLSLFLTGCAGPAMDYRSGTDFSDYRTVTLRFADEQPRTLDESRAESALRDLLPKAGLKPVPENGDLIASLKFIPYHWYDSEELFWSYGYWREPWGVGLHTPMIVEERRAVRMEFELIDPRRNHVVWRAASSGGMESWLTGAERDEWVRENLRRMLQAWPPKPD